MGDAMRVFLVVLTALFLQPASIASAADAATCDAFVALSDQAHSKIKQCRLDPGNDRWKWDQAHESNYRRFCQGAQASTVAQVSSDIRATLNKCAQCTNYANQAVAAEKENEIYHCGFGGDYDPSGYHPGRWSGDFDQHFGWCMNLGDEDSAMFISTSQASLETAGRDQELKQCKASKADAIYHCQRFVENTHSATQTIASPGFCNNADLFAELVAELTTYGGKALSPDDSVRFSWCMGLADEDQMLAGSVVANASENIRDLARECRADHVRKLKETLGVLRMKPKLNTINTSPATGRNNAGSGQSSVDRAGGGGPGGNASRVIGPGILEGTNAATGQGPASTGTPVGGGPASTTNSRGGNLR
jgi:hypothetical protein